MLDKCGTIFKGSGVTFDAEASSSSEDECAQPAAPQPVAPQPSVTQPVPTLPLEQAAPAEAPKDAETTGEAKGDIEQPAPSNTGGEAVPPASSSDSSSSSESK